jgi:hypothetical protein
MKLIYFMEGLNEQRMDREGTHSGCACACWGVCGRGCTLTNSCAAETTCFSGLSALCNFVLCTKADSTPWHDLNCLLGTCLHYGPEKMFWVCPIEQSSTQIVRWKQFGKQVTGTTEDGKERTHVKVEYMEGPPADLIDRLKTSLKFFVTHNFLARWQNEEFKQQLRDLPVNSVLSCVDFNENYTMKVQDEIQTMYYHTTQITILVMVTYRRNPSYDPCIHDSKLLKDIHHFISDEKIHDIAYVQHSFMLHWNFLKREGCFPSGAMDALPSSSLQRHGIL